MFFDYLGFLFFFTFTFIFLKIIFKLFSAWFFPLHCWFLNYSDLRYCCFVILLSSWIMIVIIKTFVLTYYSSIRLISLIKIGWTWLMRYSTWMRSGCAWESCIESRRVLNRKPLSFRFFWVIIFNSLILTLINIRVRVYWINLLRNKSFRKEVFNWITMMDRMANHRILQWVNGCPSIQSNEWMLHDFIDDNPFIRISCKHSR